MLTRYKTQLLQSKQVATVATQTDCKNKRHHDEIDDSPTQPPAPHIIPIHIVINNEPLPTSNSNNNSNNTKRIKRYIGDDEDKNKDKNKNKNRDKDDEEDDEEDDDTEDDDTEDDPDYDVVDDDDDHDDEYNIDEYDEYDADEYDEYEDYKDEEEDEDEYGEEYEEDEEEDDEDDEDEKHQGNALMKLFDINTTESILKKVNDKDLMTLLKKEKPLNDENEKIVTKFVQKASMTELKYMKSFSMEDKLTFAKEHKKLIELNNDAIPLKFKILSRDMDVNVKAIAYKKLDHLGNMSSSNGEYHKLKNWIQSLCNIPFGKFKELPIKYEEGQEKIVEFMKKTKADFDEKIYGHKEAKDQIIRIIAQWISNPVSKGNVIGIHGKPGVGKTTLIKDGLAKALDLPFAFVPLGGTHDSSFLDGHGYTYEGSTWGKIAELLMQAKYMNPIIYFDELDKISDTTKGQEIINVLIHLTDPSQNDKFNDKYFSEIPFDLSKALIIFTYNDDSSVSPILKDRMIRIETKDYSIVDKVEISRNHIVPEILKQFNIVPDDIELNDDIIRNIINNTDTEAGVRNLKRNFESIISNINLNVLLGNESYPLKVDEEVVAKYCKKKNTNVNPSLLHMYL